MTLLQIDQKSKVAVVEIPKVTLANGRGVDPIPFGVTACAPSILLITDIINHIVFELDLRKRQTRLIGGIGAPGFVAGSADSQTAPLNAPTAVAITSWGSYVVADSNNHCIKQIERESGVVSILAGSGKSGYSGDGGSARSARLSEPTNVVVDSSDRVIFTDLNNQVIRMVDLAGSIATISTTRPRNRYSFPHGLAVFDDQLAFIETESTAVVVISDYYAGTPQKREMFINGVAAPTAICSASNASLVIVFSSEGLVVWTTASGRQQKALRVHGLNEVLDVTSDSAGVVYASLASGRRF